MRRKNVKIKVIITVLLIFTAIISVFIFADKNLRVIITELSESQINLYLSDCANSAVGRCIKDNDISYNDIIVVSRNTAGEITSLETDFNALNMIRTDIDNYFSAEMNKHAKIKIYIPIGSVIGNEYTLGRGPSIPYTLDVSVNTSTDCTSQFYSAGINQTLHQIKLTVSGDAFLVSPWYKHSVEFSTDYIIAETIITGTVPNTLADFTAKK